MSVGRRLKELRKELKISQRDLGTLLNVAQQVISYYEKSSNIDASKLALIAERYCIDIRYFFGDKPISEYRHAYFETNSMGENMIPVGWDEILDDLAKLDYDKIKIVEAVVKALIKQLNV